MKIGYIQTIKSPSLKYRFVGVGGKGAIIVKPKKGFSERVHFLIKSFWLNKITLVLITIILTSCGSVQSINGISVKKKPDPKRLIVAGAVTFAVGYQVGNQFIQKKK